MLHRGGDGGVHVGHQIAGALVAEGVGIGVLKPKADTVPAGVSASCDLVRRWA
jgi:hypothetical protein